VKAEAGSGLPNGADSGRWAAGPVAIQVYNAFRVQDNCVAFAATCQFVFTGKRGSSPVRAESVVRLLPRNGVLQRGKALVLRDGDDCTDEFGNRLVAESDRKLTLGD
jgi:hypothetical protein